MANGLTFPQFNPVPQVQQLNVPGIVQAGQQAQLQQQQLDAGEIIAQRNAQINPLVEIALGGGQDALTAANQIFQLNPEVGKDVFAQQRAQAEEQRAVQAQQIQAEQLEAAEGLRIVRSILDSDHPQLFASTVHPQVLADFEADSGISLTDLSPEEFIQTAEVIEASLFAKTKPGEFDPRTPEGPFAQFVNPEDPTDIRAVRRDSQQAEDLAAQGFQLTSTVQRIETGEPGAFGAEGLSDASIKTLQSDIILIDDEIANLALIMEGFKPEFLQFGSRVGFGITQLQEILNLGEVSGERKQALTEYITFQLNAIQNLNRTIRRVTGAQMSEQEAKRIRLETADPGEGVFPAQSETSFLAKVDAIDKALKLSRARRIILLQQGISPGQTKEEINDFYDNEFTWADTRAFMDNREAELKAQGLPDAQIITTLKREFGL